MKEIRDELMKIEEKIEGTNNQLKELNKTLNKIIDYYEKQSLP